MPPNRGGRVPRVRAPKEQPPRESLRPPDRRRRGSSGKQPCGVHRRCKRVRPAKALRSDDRAGRHHPPVRAAAPCLKEFCGSLHRRACARPGTSLPSRRSRRATDQPSPRRRGHRRLRHRDGRRRPVRPDGHPARRGARRGPHAGPDARRRAGHAGHARAVTASRPAAPHASVLVGRARRGLPRPLPRHVPVLDGAHRSLARRRPALHRPGRSRRCSPGSCSRSGSPARTSSPWPPASSA